MDVAVGVKRPRSDAFCDPANGNHISCRACGKTFPWPIGSARECSMYRVFLLDEDRKTFFCTPEEYWQFRRLDPVEQRKKTAAETPAQAMDEAAEDGSPWPAGQDKHYLSLFGLSGTSIDWSAKRAPEPWTPRTQESESDGGSLMEDV